MDALIQQFATDPWGRLLLQYLVGGGLSNTFLFLLVSARLSGALLVAPCSVSSIVPISARFGLVVLLSLVITPVLSSSPDETVIRMISHETLAGHRERTAELASMVLNEIGLGTVLGLGVLTVLSGLEMGGEWLMRHTGLGLGAIMNPDGLQESATGRSFVTILGIAIFLTFKPVGGLLMILQALLQSFQSLRVGSTVWQPSLSRYLSDVLQQSFVLGLRIAMPVIAAMTLIDLTLAFVSRGTPLTLDSTGLVVRTTLSMFVLAMTMTILPDALASVATTMIETVGDFH